MGQAEHPVYETALEAQAATEAFYAERGFSYDPQTVEEWLRIYLGRIPAAGDVFDLCCGDGVWSVGLKALAPQVRLYGIDLSEAGILKARAALPEDAERFLVGNAEERLPWAPGTFDLIFARGPGLFNQHSMDRPAAIAVIERWHELLKPGGMMLSAFYSDPAQFGTYTNPLSVALPYNRAPRLTEAVDFTGGKFHHDIRSFLLPFERAANVVVGDYRFIRKNHILESRRRRADVS
jgi:SAM-dependent methyltransferase